VLVNQYFKLKKAMMFFPNWAVIARRIFKLNTFNSIQRCNAYFTTKPAKKEAQSTQRIVYEENQLIGFD
jgi:hypothetical protein